MDKVTVIYSRSHTVGSLLIRLFTWSTFSHVGLVDGDHVIEAVFPQVRRVSKAEFLKGKSSVEEWGYACKDAQAITNAAMSQVGKLYDHLFLIGFMLRRNWQDDDRWACSELIAWSFGKGGSPLFRAKRVGRVAPEHMYMLAPVK